MDLINVDFDADKGPIQELARLFNATFEFDLNARTVRFRAVST